MKTIHLPIISGIILLCVGIMLLIIIYYLQHNPANFPHCMVSGKAIACPMPPDEPYYWSYLEPITYIGIASCCVEIILMLYKTLNNRRKQSTDLRQGED
ncbi:MAG: hypothetical protein KGH87_00935 [Thaumarchaeota archaeon]|nr:hypothetical protein [Nitrososphaerota archaeon]MDE1838460.1 hypothetical protein [Nitrososphaerota archaeon]